jgi:hypothetical protein
MRAKGIRARAGSIRTFITRVRKGQKRDGLESRGDSRIGDPVQRIIEPQGDQDKIHIRITELERPSLAFSCPTSVVCSRASVEGARSLSTSRQMQLQQEAEQMHAQVVAIQQSRQASSDVDIQRLMAYIQHLEGQLDSEWARGLTDEPPPLYQP